MRLGDKIKEQCIVVSGLPGSGKSTIGRQIANELNFDFLDKDHYLEKAFRERGTGDSGWRQELSRKSDTEFQRDAISFENAVLVSRWRPGEADTLSGTPTERIGEHFSNIAELYRVCTVQEAVERFMGRNRHPGRLGCQRNKQELSQWMKEYQSFFHCPWAYSRTSKQTQM